MVIHSGDGYLPPCNPHTRFRSYSIKNKAVHYYPKVTVRIRAFSDTTISNVSAKVNINFWLNQLVLSCIKLACSSAVEDAGGGLRLRFVSYSILLDTTHIDDGGISLALLSLPWPENISMHKL